MRRHAIAWLILCLLAAPTAVHASDAGQRLRATLDGNPLRTELVGRYHCHDLDSPVISCFRTSGELEAVVEARIAVAPADALAGLSYVRVWEHVGYAGASAYFSQDYSNLGTVGWNDRITAFKSVSAGAGRFHHEVGHAGISYGFCCDQAVPMVGSAHNDKFSSVERN